MRWRRPARLPSAKAPAAAATNANPSGASGIDSETWYTTAAATSAPATIAGSRRAGRREVRMATAGARRTATASHMTAACRSTRANATDNRPVLSGCSEKCSRSSDVLATSPHRIRSYAAKPAIASAPTINAATATRAAPSRCSVVSRRRGRQTRHRST